MQTLAIRSDPHEAGGLATDAARRPPEADPPHPPEVVQDAFLFTLYPPFDFSALEENGYQKCEPVSGSE